MVHPAIPTNAEQPNLLNGLVAKRAQIAGQIEANQEELRKLINDLDAVEATIRVFDPNVDLNEVYPRPVPPRHAAFKGEVTRIVFKALREAEEPLTSRQIALVLMRERGLNTENPELRVLMTTRVGACLSAKRDQQKVRSVEITGRLLGWELVR